MVGSTDVVSLLYRGGEIDVIRIRAGFECQLDLVVRGCLEAGTQFM
jgi:hypothetical protein